MRDRLERAKLAHDEEFAVIARDAYAQQAQRLAVSYLLADNDIQFEVATVSHETDDDSLAGARFDDRDEIVEGHDRLAVNRGDAIADLQAGGGCGATLAQLTDDGRRPPGFEPEAIE